MRSDLPDDHELQPGQILGPYELLVPVGSGGMARVWAARHRGAGAIFALKMLMPHLAENAAFRDMFFDEARLASRIRHDNVARTFELVDLDGILTIVMEWVDGSSMVRLLKPGPEDREDTPRVALPVRAAVKIIAETCAGLHAAHGLIGDDGRSLGVVHRDVSPHNILLTLDGRVKVTDFGVAKALGKSHMTLAGQVKGKLAYMSPEQLVGGGVDRRSDVFALGSVLYETTTGERPFQGEHDPQVMASIIMGNFVPPSEVVRGYPRGLEEIVLHALAVEPEKRFATALEMKQALESWLQSSGPPIGPAQISQLLHERCGPELAARLGVLSVSKPTLAVSATGPHPRVESGGGIEVDRRSLPNPPERSQGVSLVGAVVAVLVGLVLGLAVLVYVKNARRERREALEMSVVDAGTTPSMEVSAALDAAVTTTAEIEDAADATAAEAIVSEVRLRVPEGAHLFVEGRELSAGTLTVPRPDAGVVTVLVKAEGREDRIVEITPTSPDEIEVTLAEKHRPRPRPSASEADPGSDISMPPNPYE